MCRCISAHAAVGAHTPCRGSLNWYRESQFGHGRLPEKANISQCSYTYSDLSTGEWMWMQRLASHLQTSLSDGRRRRETWGGGRERERDGVMWRLKCRLWRDKDGEREGGQTDKTEEGIHKKNNDQQPSSHRVRFLLFFFSNHSHPHAALDLLFCCYDGKRDNKKEWITHKNTPFIVQNRLRLQLLMMSGTCWMRARQQTDTANHSFSSTSKLPARFNRLC